MKKTYRVLKIQEKSDNSDINQQKKNMLKAERKKAKEEALDRITGTGQDRAFMYSAIKYFIGAALCGGILYLVYWFTNSGF